MAEPITQDPAAPPAPRKPIDLARIMGTPTPRPTTGEQGRDDSWLDMPISAPEVKSAEEPSWFDGGWSGFKEGSLALARGPANALASAANLVNAGARLLPGVDETTFGGMFAPVPEHPLGTSQGLGAAIVENVTQFGAGFAVAGPAVKAVGAGVKGAEILLAAKGGLSIPGAAAAGAVTDFAAFDAQAGRLTDLIGNIPGLEGLDLTSADDGEIEGRLKNALEGLGIGAGLQAVVNVVRFKRAATRAVASGMAPEEAIAKAQAAVPDIQKSLADLYDMRLPEASPFKGELVDEAVMRSKGGEQWVNVDGSQAVGFEKLEVGEKMIDAPRPELEDLLKKNLQYESVVATDVLGRELQFDDAATNAYIDALRKARDETNPEHAAAASQVEGIKARLSARGRKRLESTPPSGHETQVLMLAMRVKEGDWAQRANPIMQGARMVRPRFVPIASAKVGDEQVDKALLTAWVNKHGTLLDNPQTTIKLNPDGTAEIGVSLRADQWTPEAKRIAESIKNAPDMTPSQLGEAAQGLTKPKQPSPPNPEPPRVEPPVTGAGGGPPESGLPVAASSQAARLTPHQIYLGEIGFDAKTADEIGEILQGEFVEGMAERGQVAIEFKARGEPFTEATNPKRMSRENLLRHKLREKGLNLEGLKGQPEVGGQAVRTLEKMYAALSEAENPLLVKESFAAMNARAQEELDTILAIPTSYGRSAYMKQAEKAGVEAANKVGAQAKAATDLLIGAAMELQAKAAEMFARKQANIPIQPWEYAAWSETRGLANDARSMASNLKNALSRNLYMQRGEIKPAKGAVARMTAVQLQQDDAALARIIMENGGLDKIERDVELIAGAGTRDLYGIAHTLQLARGSNGLLGMTIETGYAAMLSGLGTPIAQLFGNLTTAAYLPFRRGFSAAMALPYTRDPQAVAALKGEIAESLATYIGMFRSIPEVARAYKTGFLHGPTLNPRGGVFDASSRARMQQVTAQNFGLDLDSPEGMLIEGVGDAMSAPTRQLQGGDEATRVLLYRTTAQARLARLGLESGLSGEKLGAAVAEDMDRLIYKGQALSVDQLERRAVDQVQREGYTGIHFIERKNRLVAEWQKSEWYKRLSGLSEFASEMGGEASFSNPLDPRTVGGWIQKGLSRHPVYGFVISPFHRTSVNIAKFALQHFDFPSYARWMVESKLNRPGTETSKVMTRMLADMRSGDPIRMANARGRLILGSTFASGIAAMYMSGMVVGRGPADKRLRSQMMEAGWLPYSLHINGKYYSYKRLEPLATVIGLVADVSQSFSEVPDDRVADVGDMAMGVGTALAANLTNKSYAKGLADFTQAITSPAEYLEDWAGSIATRFVPNIVRDLVTVTDPVYKEIRGIHDAMIAKIPWASDGLEPRRNILGEPIERPKRLGEETLGSWSAPFSIVQVGKGSDALKNELASLEYAFSVPGSKRDGYDMLDIKAANGQTAYDRWLENSGVIRLGGKNLREALEHTIQSDAYQRMSAEGLNGEPSQRALTVMAIVGRYRDAARMQTQREIPEMNEAEMASRMARAASR